MHLISGTRAAEMTITLSATLFRSIGNVLKNILALTLIDINMTLLFRECTSYEMFNYTFMNMCIHEKDMR